MLRGRGGGRFCGDLKRAVRNEQAPNENDRQVAPSVDPSNAVRRDQNSAGKYPLISMPMQISSMRGVDQAMIFSSGLLLFLVLG